MVGAEEKSQQMKELWRKNCRERERERERVPTEFGFGFSYSSFQHLSLKSQDQTANDLRGEKTGVGGACPGGHCQELTMWV
jgi:hypothetical protein